MNLETLEKKFVEINKEKVIHLLEGTKYYTYNPYTKGVHEEVASKRDVAHNKYVISSLRYFIEDSD